MISAGSLGKAMLLAAVILAACQFTSCEPARVIDWLCGAGLTLWAGSGWVARYQRAKAR